VELARVGGGSYEEGLAALDMDAVGPGSLILITSCDRDILNTRPFANINTLVYDAKPLKKKNAQELFCHHDFLQSKPFEGYEDLVEKFLEMCGGLRLCVKVLGETTCWQA